VSTLQPEDIVASRRRVTRVLFAAMVFVVPMPFSMLFIVGLVPLACTVAWFLRPVPLALLAAPILALHVAVDGGLLYLGAAFVSRVLFWPRSRRFAQFGVAVLIALGVVWSSFPIYTVMGEHNAEVMNVAGAWRQFVMHQRPPPRRR